MSVSILITAIAAILFIFVSLIVILWICSRQIDRLRHSYETRIDQLTRRLEDGIKEQRRDSALEFKTIAEDILSDKSGRLTSENERQINQLISPLRSEIESFKTRVSEFYVNGESARASIKTQIERLMEANRAVGEEARRLTNALTSNIRVQGKWGETVLETLLTRAGMVKGINFFTQDSKADGAMINDYDASGLRPDVLVVLPDGHKVVIDAKVSLTAFMQFYNSDNKDTENAALKRHMDSVKKHVDELARKQYHKNIKGALEHTLMFIPNDSAYIAALSDGGTLGEYAYSRNIVIVSSTHIFSVIQLIHQLWRVEKQNQNAEEIARLGGLIFDKLINFFDDFKSINNAIGNVAKAYDKCIAHIDHPTVGLKARASKLRDLGSKTTKKLD